MLDHPSPYEGGGHAAGNLTACRDSPLLGHNRQTANEREKAGNPGPQIAVDGAENSIGQKRLTRIFSDLND